mmetsp:Transcript_14873/g.40952  ORF Transcript_14873/g.40952 Transcript_14873/m.40952 type:complete len:204 (-) Transcript_14873:600-1211(-)
MWSATSATRCSQFCQPKRSATGVNTAMIWGSQLGRPGIRDPPWNTMGLAFNLLRREPTILSNSAIRAGPSVCNSVSSEFKDSSKTLLSSPSSLWDSSTMSSIVNTTEGTPHTTGAICCCGCCGCCCSSSSVLLRSSSSSLLLRSSAKHCCNVWTSSLWLSSLAFAALIPSCKPMISEFLSSTTASTLEHFSTTIWFSSLLDDM